MIKKKTFKVFLYLSVTSSICTRKVLEDLRDLLYCRKIDNLEYSKRIFPSQSTLYD